MPRNRRRVAFPSLGAQIVARHDLSLSYLAEATGLTKGHWSRIVRAERDLTPANEAALIEIGGPELVAELDAHGLLRRSERPR